MIQMFIPLSQSETAIPVEAGNRRNGQSSAKVRAVVSEPKENSTVLVLRKKKNTPMVVQDEADRLMLLWASGP